MRLRSMSWWCKDKRACPGMSEVSGSIPESLLRFLYIFVVFTSCLPLFIDC